VAVCIRPGGDEQLRTRTLASVRAGTASEVPVLLIEPGEDPFARTARADVVLLEPGCVVATGWLDGLRRAALAGGTTATAAAVTQRDLDPRLRLDAERFEEAAAEVRSRSPRLRPRLVDHAAACLYVRRSAVELAGWGEDFLRRCLENGLVHVLADDVLVLDARLAADGPPALDDGRGPVARTLGAARRALSGLSAVIDARILYGATTGSAVHVLELIAGLARTGKVSLTVIVPDRPSDHAISRLQSLPKVSLITYGEASNRVDPAADVVHRPFQLTNAGDLIFLAQLGRRLVLTHQDLIAFHNPAYFPSVEAWEGYRRLTRLALGAIDRVVFFSAFARDDALAEELVAPERASVVRLGVDHSLSPWGGPPIPVAPAAAETLGSDTEVILCLGTDLLHKNRLFALRMLEQLRARHGWDGVLVFAGPEIRQGSSRPQEALLLEARPGLAASVLDVGAVSEAAKAWLYGRSALAIYPSVVEGFGLVPFEAAAHRVPCMWAAGSSLSELLPDASAEITPWDAELSAARALALMREPDARERNLQAVDAAASDLTWDATAAGMLEVYRTTAEGPANRGLAAAGTSALGPLSEDAARLVGPHGELPPDVHRPLLALATHRRLAAPVFGALKLGYRASYELRRRRHRSPRWGR
jgi:glycosyltransferase involved in cell wall biosynthesis